MVLQFCYGFLTTQPQFPGKLVHVSTHLTKQFIFGDSANAGIRLVHADVLDVVQLAEDAELRELCDSSQENEAEHRFAILKRRVEVAHRVPQDIKIFPFMSHVKQRCVIFIDERDNLPAGLLIYGLYQVEEPNVRIGGVAFDTETGLIVVQYKKQIALQLILLHVLATGQAEVQHRILLPFTLHFLNGKPLEDFLSPLEVTPDG